MKTDNTNQKNNQQLEREAMQMAGLLDENAQQLNMLILRQLEDGRNRAIARHQAQQESTLNIDSTLSHCLGWATHHRIVMMSLVLSIGLSTFAIMQHLSANETSDAFLLGADLPPEAFVDKGFEPSLNQSLNL
ncbi:MAG: DUF3619 family protein [Methylophilaceae bacterium]|nr:DUF3619 family protein [Methylophilaceae bacterium]